MKTLQSTRYDLLVEGAAKGGTMPPTAALDEILSTAGKSREQLQADTAKRRKELGLPEHTTRIAAPSARMSTR
jgi:hypothetical protein